MERKIYKNEEEAEEAIRKYLEIGKEMGIDMSSDDPYCAVECCAEYYGEDGEIKMICV